MVLEVNAEAACFLRDKLVCSVGAAVLSREKWLLIQLLEVTIISKKNKKALIRGKFN